MCVWVCVCCHEASHVSMLAQHAEITPEHYELFFRHAVEHRREMRVRMEAMRDKAHSNIWCIFFAALGATKIKTSNNKTRNFMSLFSSSSSSPSPSWSFFFTIRLTCVWALVCLFITRRRNNLFGVLSPCVVCDCFFFSLVRLRMLERMF